jgi:hypothetical protein
VLSRRATGRLLFAVAVIALPLPWYLGEVERAPLVRLAFFTGIFGRVMLAEGATGTTRLFFGLGVAQLVLYATAVRLLAALVARALAGLRSPALRTLAVAGLAMALLGAGLLPIYDTPLSSHRARSSLLGVFD